MRGVSWTQIAVDDLCEAQADLDEQHASRGEDLIDRATAAARFLLDFPAIGTPMTRHWRKLRIPKTRYLLLHRPTRGGIEIGRVRYDRSNWTLVPS